MTPKQLLASVAALACLIAPTATLADSTLDILHSYYAYDAVPLNLDLPEAVVTDGVARQDLSFDAFDNERITARLEIPQGADTPPVIILLHGITQSYDQWWRTDGGEYSFPSAHRAALLDAGYAVLAMDARNHGRRIGDTDFPNAVEYLNSGYFEAARKMISQSAIDVRRLIDVAETLDGVDSSRIGVAGFSLGASIGYLASANDPRVSSAVLIGYPFIYGDQPGGAGFTSPFQYTAAMQDRPLLFVAGENDHFHTREVIEALAAELGETTQVDWQASGHDYPPETASLTIGHFDTTLR